MASTFRPANDTSPLVDITSDAPIENPSEVSAVTLDATRTASGKDQERVGASDSDTVAKTDSSGESKRQTLLELAADMVAKAHDDATQRFDEPVLVLLDPDDALAQTICQQYGLESELQVMPLERADALQLLIGGDADDAAAQLLLSEGPFVRVIVIAHEGASVRTIPL